MKQISLALIFLLSISFYSCDSRKEKRTKKENQSELNTYLDETNDYTEEYEYVPESINDSVLATTNDSSYKSTKSDSIEIVDLNPNKNETQKVNLNNTETNKTTTNTETVKPHEKRFYIVAGSFNKYHNAVKLDQFFKSKGYYSMVLPKMNNYNRVAIMSYTDEQQARKKVTQLKDQYKDIDFWLFKW